MSVTLNTLDWVITERITGENDPDGHPDSFNRVCKQIWKIFAVEHDKDGDHKSDFITHYLQVEEGTYTGNATDDRTISLTDSNLKPILVIVLSDTATPIYFRVETSVMSGDNTKAFLNTAFAANLIQDIGTGSFEVGDHANINTNDETYYYLVLGTY